jgi:hypothetical protein
VGAGLWRYSSCHDFTAINRQTQDDGGGYYFSNAFYHLGPGIRDRAKGSSAKKGNPIV